ncbi:MAG: DUF5995 family protein [Ilumatobacteraceae bacterium]
MGTTYDETIDALTTIVDRCSADGDRAGYFAAMYLAVTRTVRRRASEGRFQDAARMERFVTGFATRYLDAEAAWRGGRPCTESWQAAFDASRRWRPIILQHLLLGMNAHINLDLGIAAADLAPGTGIEAVRADFDAVNGVLAELVDGCQGALGQVSPWFGLVDRIGGRKDEALIRFSLVVARRQAWSAALRLAALSGAARDAEIAAIDHATAGVAHVVAHPGAWASTLLTVVRLRERAAPAKVIALLAAVQPRA